MYNKVINKLLSQNITLRQAKSILLNYSIFGIFFALPVNALRTRIIGFKSNELEIIIFLLTVIFTRYIFLCIAYKLADDVNRINKIWKILAIITIVFIILLIVILTKLILFPILKNIG